ncbi:MAG: sodium:alanine symporter family protein [Clostridia bacterium]|nr:sodium:alanine symporter family protein [Clostridia bacterium]
MQFFQKIFDAIVNANDFVNGIVWGFPLLVLILGVGIYFTVRLGFFQFTNPGYVFRNTVKKAFQKKDETKPAPGELTSFQAAMTSVAAIVGSGNIAGVATAIVVGGPGALVWIIIAALFGMASKFAEITLGIKYREFHEDGTVTGGAMYYLAKGLKQKWLGILFSILVIPFAFVISGIVDTNTIALTLKDYFNVPTIVTGIVLAVVVALIIFFGVKRIGYACSLVAPFMGAAYVLAGLLIIILNITKLPAAVGLIVKSAFKPPALAGGAVGTFFICMKTGVARGLYSNEAGLGTAAMVHAGAQVNHPVEQGLWGPMEVFLDTIVVCTISALAIVMSGLWNTGLDGATLTVSAFEALLPGKIGAYVCIGAVVLFGFSCLISYYVYAERAIEYIFGSKSKLVVKILWVITIVIGSQTTLGFVWDLADTCNGLMIIPNLIGLLLLSGEVVKLKKQYFNDPETGLRRASKNAK